ncbi:MAG: RNA 2',3'-cyclic phosphodiesterase [Thermodesulfovibrionales bacterium]|nr:RNA 2',3'-cyclic phosphodiesterase [Thermodesulfovibrionales bacterium]
MRCFIAVDLPQEIKTEVERVVGAMSLLSKEIKWVPSENIHITIKFLGEIKESIIPKIEQRLNEVCRRHRPFNIKIKGAGAFPNEKKPNVLWIGIDKSDTLINLYQDIESSLLNLGFNKETREFSPHLTIGRVKNPIVAHPLVKGLMEYKDKVFGIATVTEFYLMKSLLLPSGAQYSKLLTFKLSG